MVHNRILFAVVGDVHGAMKRMVQLLHQWEIKHHRSLDFVLQLGDFEPHRHEQDLATMAAPQKYRKLGDFPLFYSGKFTFPWPIYFIGGNHEPYGWLDTLEAGAMLTKHCYYLGRTPMIHQYGLRIRGLSGIYKSSFFTKERPKYTEHATIPLKNYTFFTENEVENLMHSAPIDILLLHEWPSGLMTQEEFFKNEPNQPTTNMRELGNEPARMLIELVEPQLVFCGHMHTRHQTTLLSPSGHTTSVYCLANIAQGQDALAFFEVDVANNRIRELQY